MSALDDLVVHHDDLCNAWCKWGETARAELATLRAENANRIDALNAWVRLWEHICNVMNCPGWLPSEMNFDAMLTALLAAHPAPQPSEQDAEQEETA